MRHTYQYLAIEHDGRVTTDKEQIDSATWLDYLRTHQDRYGNLHEYIAASLANLPAETPLVAADMAGQIDEIFRTQEPTAVFQFAMYCWDAFNAGRLSAGAWGAVLGTAWGCGERAMLDHVPLSSALIVRMFEAADKAMLFRVGTGREDWDDYLAALPERIPVYRGVTTATKYGETGLCWTTQPEKAKQFSGQNVRNLTDIPGVLHAIVPKTAVLAVFGQGDELVLDPTAPKEALQSSYLSGPGLSKFRQNWKKWKAEAKKRQEA